MKKIKHYTSLSKAWLILKDLEIKFGNVLNSNDVLEKMNVEEDEFSYYVFCTSIAPLDALMYMNYKKNEPGATIEFCIKEECDLSSLFNDKSIDSFNIKYVDNYFYNISEKIELMCKIKSTIFASEKEYRYLIKRRLLSNYVKAKINTDSLDHINLYIDEEYIEMFDTIKQKLLEKNLDLNIVDFYLSNEI